MEFSTAGWAADWIYFKADIFNSKIIKNGFGKADDFCIGKRGCSTEAFNTELMKFTKPACLWLFIAIAGGQIANLLRQCFVAKSAFKKGSCCTCCSFGAKCNVSAAFIIKGIHFLLNNIRCVAHTALEKLGMFKNRGSYFLKAVFFCNIKNGCFNILILCTSLGKTSFVPFIAFVINAICISIQKRVSICPPKF